MIDVKRRYKTVVTALPYLLNKPCEINIYLESEHPNQVLYTLFSEIVFVHYTVWGR